MICEDMGLNFISRHGCRDNCVSLNQTAVLERSGNDITNNKRTYQPEPLLSLLGYSKKSRMQTHLLLSTNFNLKGPSYNEEHILLVSWTSLLALPCLLVLLKTDAFTMWEQDQEIPQFNI